MERSDPIRPRVPGLLLALMALVLQTAALASAGACADMECPRPPQDALAAPCCCGDDCGVIDAVDAGTATLVGAPESWAPMIGAAPALPTSRPDADPGRIAHPGTGTSPPARTPRPAFLLHGALRR